MTSLSSKTSLSFAEPTDIFVCDPCYILQTPRRDDIWKAVCDLWFSGEDSEWNPSGVGSDLGAILHDDSEILYSSTAYGDGIYSISFLTEGTISGENIVGVDSGTICVVKLKDALRILPTLNLALGVVVKDFKGIVTATGKGFEGDLLVITDDSDAGDYNA